jgi:hypothetical protein
MKFTSILCLSGLCAATTFLATPARAEDSAAWQEAIDGKGEFAYLRDWLIGDKKIVGGDGVVRSKFFKDAILGTKPLPLPLIREGLAMAPDASSLSSKYCVGSWGCKALAPSFELLVLRRDAAHKPLIEAFFANDASWQVAGFSSRGYLVRMIGWYNDKSFAPLVVKMATHQPDSEYTMDAIQSAAALFGQWNDASLVDACTGIFDIDKNGVSAVGPARQACAWYLIKMGDKSVAKKLKRAPIGSEWVTTVTAAAMGNADDKAEWQATAKEFAGSPDRTDHAAAIVALALTGDAKAEKQVIALLGGKEPGAAWEHATLLPNYAYTAVGKRILAAVKKPVFALGVKEKAGRVHAVVAAQLARLGDVSAVPEITKLFASDDESVREVLAAMLGTGSPGVVLRLPANGLAGGAPVAGLAAVLQEAFENESNLGARGAIARAWAMTVPAGGN